MDCCSLVRDYIVRNFLCRIGNAGFELEREPKLHVLAARAIADAERSAAVMQITKCHIRIAVSLLACAETSLAWL